MIEKITFLPQIDRKATQVRLEEVLENVRLHRQFGMIRQEMKLTPSYNPRYHGVTNDVGKPAEEVALVNIKRSEREDKLAYLSKRIDIILSRFTKIQRDIINKRYLEEDDMKDFLLYGELGMSERTYRRHRDNAFYKLAFALRLEVYEEDVQV